MPIKSIAESKSSATSDPFLNSRDILFEAMEKPVNRNMADTSYEIIMERIKEFEEDLFEEDLKEDEEIAIRLASFGQSITMSVTDIGYSNPNILVFYGYVGESSATLVQHMSQLNFLLLAVKKADPEKPARRIGFAQPNED